MRAPASEPKLTNPSEVLQAIKGLRVGRAPGPNGIPNRVLEYLPKRAITFLTKVFNAVLRRRYFPPAWKHACMVSILKLGKDPTLPSSYRPISLLDTSGKLFEKILLSKVLKEVKERGLLCDEQFGFQPRLITTLQLARPVERVNRNLDERRHGIPGCSKSIRHRMGRRPPLQAHCPQLSALPGENHFLVSPMSDVPNDLPINHIHLSRHASWCRPGRSCFPCAVQPVCKRHSYAVSPRSAGTLRGRHGSNGHGPQPLLSLQLPGGLPLQTRTLATGMEDFYQRF